MPVAKREILVQNLVVLAEGRFTEEDLKGGTITLIANVPVKKTKILETILGGFCFLDNGRRRPGESRGPEMKGNAMLVEVEKLHSAHRNATFNP